MTTPIVGVRDYRPQGKLKSTAAIKRLQTVSDTQGRVKESFVDNAETIDVIVAQSDPKDRNRNGQEQHPAEYTLVQRGAPVANEGDRLDVDGLQLYVIKREHAVKDMYTLYYCDRRRDK